MVPITFDALIKYPLLVSSSASPFSNYINVTSNLLHSEATFNFIAYWLWGCYEDDVCQKGITTNKEFVRFIDSKEFTIYPCPRSFLIYDSSVSLTQNSSLKTCSSLKRTDTVVSIHFLFASIDLMIIAGLFPIYMRLPWERQARLIMQMLSTCP